jgi:hypothetical protein
MGSRQVAKYVWSAARLQEKSWDRESKSAQMYSAFDGATVHMGPYTAILGVALSI